MGREKAAECEKKGVKRVGGKPRMVRKEGREKKRRARRGSRSRAEEERGEKRMERGKGVGREMER